MRHGQTLFATILLGALTLLITGCGASGSNSLLPTGPSGTTAGRAQIAGHVTGTATNSSPSTTSFSALTGNALTTTSTSMLKVSISGTDIATSVDGSGQFTLDDVPPGTVTLTFSGSGLSANITLSGVNAGDRIEIEVRLEGSGARIESERRHHEGDADDDDHDGDRDDEEEPDGLEVEGAISELSGSCPMLSFTVGERHISTNDATIFRDTTCGALKDTVRVEVHGSLNADGTLAASRVELDD